MSLVDSLAGAWIWGMTAPLRGAVAVVDAGLELERRARAAVLAAAGTIALDALDAVLGSPVRKETGTRLLESDQLWILVDEIARSPSVTQAITSQSASFVEEVTDRVRDSSRDADAWVERAARRVGRRRLRPRTS